LLRLFKIIIFELIVMEDTNIDSKVGGMFDDMNLGSDSDDVGPDSE